MRFILHTSATPSGDALKEERPKNMPLSPSRFLAVIGHGCSLLVIRRVSLVVTVLPSLTLLYSVSTLHMCVCYAVYIEYPVITSLCLF